MSISQQFEYEIVYEYVEDEKGEEINKLFFACYSSFLNCSSIRIL